MAYRMFIKVGTKEALDLVAEKGTPYFKRCEIMIIKNFEYAVPKDERSYWVELEYKKGE